MSATVHEMPPRPEAIRRVAVTHSVAALIMAACLHSISASSRGTSAKEMQVADVERRAAAELKNVAKNLALAFDMPELLGGNT